LIEKISIETWKKQQEETDYTKENREELQKNIAKR
jgi:hypothetical protein